MKVIWFVALLALTVLGVLVLAGQTGMLKGKVPGNLGVRDGHLKPPSLTPNSVSSQAYLYPDHQQRSYAQIEPFRFSGNGEAAMAKIANIVKNKDRTVLVTQEPDYIYAQCTSRVLQFTDDLEFWLDRTAGVIHVRSASRLGRKDMHANRSRVEDIRVEYLKYFN